MILIVMYISIVTIAWAYFLYQRHIDKKLERRNV